MLPRILSLSNTIFSAEPTSKYASLPEWQIRLAKPSSLIVFFTALGNDAELAGVEPIAFVFAHPRVQSPPLHDGTTESLHIWLAGVLPRWRKAGCLGRLVDALAPGPGRHLTVSTVPAVYPDMWSWLQKRGWMVERELSEGKFLLSRR